jgi:predicted GNAT family acetyltransferase
MHQRGMSKGALYVDAANGTARSMYEKLGFTEEHHDRAYVIDI